MYHFPRRKNKSSCLGLPYPHDNCRKTLPAHTKVQVTKITTRWKRQLTRVVEARHVIHVQMETTKRPLGSTSPRQGERSCKGGLNMFIGTVTDWGTRSDSCMGIFALGGAHCSRPQSQNSPLPKPFRAPTIHRKPPPPHMHSEGGGGGGGTVP